jgi:orotate phosphoribosyltransferase
MEVKSELPDLQPANLQEIASLDSNALRSRLLDHIEKRSILRGDFTLKSGLKSAWFIDAKKTVCSPDGMLLVANAIYRLLPMEATAIGGLTMGADPVAFSSAAVSTSLGHPLRSFSVRKEVKDHGGGGRIAGMLDPQDKVVITEDAVTRGTSMLEAVKAVREIGAEVVLAIAMVDRGGSAKKLLGQVGVKFQPLFTAHDLGFEYEGGLEL